MSVIIIFIDKEKVGRAGKSDLYPISQKIPTQQNQSIERKKKKRK